MIAILILAAFAQSQTQAQASAPENPPIVVEGEKSTPEKKVCRTERETGSRMVKRICVTPSESRQVQLQDRAKLRLGNTSTQPTEVFRRPRDD